MSRQLMPVVAIGATLLSAGTLFGQLAAPPRVGPQPSLGNAALRPNSFEANKSVAMNNKIVKPIPLTADAQRNALTNIDRSLSEQVGQLNEKIKTILPDELGILAKTEGWKPDDQQALVVALRSGDPTAVYEAWAKGNPRDTAGAEIAARQTDVKRIMTRLMQDVEKNKAAVRQNVADLTAALGKISGATPAVSDLSATVSSLKTWVDARQLIESAVAQKGPVAKIPTGNVTLISDPSLALGTAIVLSDQAMLIGNEGAGGLTIATGNAAQALQLPIVTGTPLPKAEGEEITSGTLVVNPSTTRGTVNYNVNGHHFVAEPGMNQRLAPNHRWVIEYDRGRPFGSSAYTLASGTYCFRPTDLGWQLYKYRYDVVLDNSQNNQEFNYIYQGQDLTVPAGGSRTITSPYPIVVRFDRGNGGEFVAKSMPFSGTVQIGVNATDNLWDLFPTSENRRETANLKAFSTEGLPKRQ